VAKNVDSALFGMALGVGLVLLALLGLYGYLRISSKPLHPDVRGVPSVQPAGLAPEWAAAVERAQGLARAALVAQNLPGLSVAVGAGGELVWAEGFGWADLERRVPVAPEMRFRIGAVSIALTSAAVGLLLEDGRLRLDEPIQTYVPAFPAKTWPVTLRALMAHVAGVRHYRGESDYMPTEHCERAEQGLHRFADDPLRFEPGTRYRYSTYGWVLVSAAVEAVANEPFSSFLGAQVLAPLGLRDTQPDTLPPPTPEGLTFYYPRLAADTRYGPELASEADHSCFAGAAGLVSTPSDLVRFALALQSGKLLAPETVALLQAPAHLASGEELGYGLGWDLETVPLAGQPARMVGHDSEYAIGGSASLVTWPEHGLVVAVTSNISFADTWSIAASLAQAFAEPSDAARTTPEPPAPER
jgi:CubicO group peptidase (beta-lactamase class C family)